MVTERIYNLTQKANDSLHLAQDEATRLQQPLRRTHLLLGILMEGHGVGAKVMTNLGVTLELFRPVVESINAPADVNPALVTTDPPSLLQELRGTLQRAMTYAIELNHPYIGTGHLLVGLFPNPPEEDEKQKDPFTYLMEERFSISPSGIRKETAKIFSETQTHQTPIPSQEWINTDQILILHGWHKFLEKLSPEKRKTRVEWLLVELQKAAQKEFPSP